MDPRSIVLAIGLSSLASALLLGAGRFWSRRRDGQPASDVAPTSRWRCLAVGVGVIVGYVLLVDANILAPDTTYYTFYLTLVGLLVGVLPGQGFWKSRWRWILLAPLGVLALALMLVPSLSSGWSPEQSLTRILPLSLALLAGWWLIDRLAWRGGDLSVILGWLVVALGHAVAQILSGSIMLGLIALAFVGPLAALAVIPPRRIGPESLFLVLIPQIVLLGNGYCYSEMPLASMVCLELAWLTPWVARLPWLNRRPAWVRCLATVLVAAILVGASVGLAWSTMPADDPYSME